MAASSSSSTSFRVPGSFNSAGCDPDTPPQTYFRNRFPPSSSDSPTSSTVPPFPSSSTTSRPPSPTPADDATLRTCRICFDSVPANTPPDPILGRLLSPCRCRGTSKYVHEECLNRWRLTSSNSKSYYQCNTCGYKYRLRRLRLSRWVGSRALQFFITSTLLLKTVYLLGFIADPIFTAYFNSSALPSPPPGFRPRSASPNDPSYIDGSIIPLPQPGSLAEHMLKGLTSLGLLGFIKVIWFFGPQSWWNLRQSGLFSTATGRFGRPGGSGRDRLGQLGWIVVAVGLFNFFVWLWKLVSAWTRGWLDKAAEEILDVDEEEVRQEEGQ